MIALMGFKLFYGVKDFLGAKNKKPKIKAVMSIVFVPVVFVALIGFYSFISFVLVDTSSQTNAIKGYEVVNDNYAAHYALKDYVSKNINEVYWDNIPKGTKNVLQNNWTLIFDTKVPTSMQPRFSLGANQYDKTGLTLSGLTHPQKRLVFVNTLLRYEDFQSSYIHEYGHVVSYEYGNLHGSTEWKHLYYTNKDNAPAEAQGYYVSDSAEFFAWSYSTYFLKPELLKSTLPEIYDYMDELNHTDINQNFFSELQTGMKGIVNTFIFHMV